ncbi:peptidoglycan-binding protein [Yinghuangia seranimata]|uniref:peptidoglycan-binding protein n=1 Tax=Yinghuangia seranimata TaxID=408067 RepID=UPI00248C27D7|nr:peptidoglycan-binding protein [Yinghuangia seranimata]MDI2125888.1 peptidoglycan-binding protein [Yinghuangia seranimata]
MDTPVFDDIADPSCTCLACVSARRQEALAQRHGGGPARRARRTAATVVTAGFVAAGVAPAAARVLDHDTAVDDQGPRQPLSDGPLDQEQRPFDGTAAGSAVDALDDTYGDVETPQGEPGPLRFGGSSGGKTVTPGLGTAGLGTGLATVTRQQIIDRAQGWADLVVPYSQSGYRGGYRTDCSGFVSMAWGLSENAWTGNLDDYAVLITKSDLKPGDILLFHNSADPVRGSHVVIFDRWVDGSHTSYVGYEQTPPGTKHRTIPYAYFSYASSYKPYRYKNVVDDGTGGGTTTPRGAVFPGAQYFGPGKSNAYITQLGTMLVAAGYGRYYSEGPGPTWGSADQNATAAFQRDQGWTGSDADGIPGKDTWARLTAAAGTGGGSSGGGTTTPRTGNAFPGAQYFGPGQSNAYITQLGQALVGKGYGGYYSEGPGPTWGDADRNATAAFQRDQGWTGSEADGIPGKDTWALLMR